MPRDVFLKAYECAKERYGKYGALQYSHFDDSEELDKQFNHLRELHSVSPDNIVRPIAIVVDRYGMVGYLAERARGRSLEDIWKTVCKADKEGRRRAGLFRQATFQMIDTLHTLNQHGLSHGDAAMRNAKVSGSGRVKLFDPIGGGMRMPFDDAEAIMALLDNIAFASAMIPLVRA